MRGALFLACVLTSVTFLAGPASAHEGYAAAGVATNGVTTAKILVSREFDLTGLFFRVILTDLVTSSEIVHHRFAGEDNYNASDDPTFTNTEYGGHSADPTVTFHFHGTQFGESVTGTGSYEGYEFAATISLI